MVLLSRIIAALAYAGAAFLFGLATGERGELGFVQHVFTVVIPLTAIVLTFVVPHGRINVLFTGLAMWTGLYLGQTAFKRAFDECPTRAPAVRAAIVQHRMQTGDYPPRLRDLKMDLPCDCILRKSILHYAASDRGVRLWITNDARTMSV